MKVKILEGAATYGAFNTGDIVDAKRFKEITDKELLNQNYLFKVLYAEDDIFISCHGKLEYMSDDEVEIINE